MTKIEAPPGSHIQKTRLLCACAKFVVNVKLNIARAVLNVRNDIHLPKLRWTPQPKQEDHTENLSLNVYASIDTLNTGALPQLAQAVQQKAKWEVKK